VNALADAIDSARRRRKTVTLYSPDDSDPLAEALAVRNVDVERQPLPEWAPTEFLVVRGLDEEFEGSIGVAALQQFLGSDDRQPWASGQSEVAAVFDFLDDAVFSSLDRRQLLAASREIEERAWRAAAGRLYTGFQTESAFAAQAEVYDRLADRGELSVRCFARGEGTRQGSRLRLVDREAVGDYWFVVYDGGGDDDRKCALVAEQRGSDEYTGFWTYDPETVDDLVTYLAATYES